MTHGGSNAPSWLFSFVDLAFLLLIAMTQIGDSTQQPELGEMLVPRIRAEASSTLPPDSAARWQLRVHPREGDLPFELLRTRNLEIAEGAERLDHSQLRSQLANLHRTATPRPLLAPHRDSRAEDLLEAAGLLEELWPRRRATIAPLLASR